MDKLYWGAVATFAIGWYIEQRMAYTRNADLWIKAQCTFEGLKQCLYQPAERIYIGSVPPVLDRVNKNAKSVIKSISVSPTPDAKHASEKWFDFSLPLNPGLVAVIGNKGSGKSALSDIEVPPKS